jgi:hypothetical protein
MNNNPMLLVDSCVGSGFTLNLNESTTTENGTVKFKGKFQEAEAVNKNKRMYPFGVLDENVKRLNDHIKGRGLIGELDHPTDSIIHFTNASHIVTQLWWEGNTLMGEGEILNTPHGKVLKSLINDGVRVGISSRGVGNGKVNENGILVIGESYKLITFDAVADPSTSSAFQEKVTKAKKEAVNNNNVASSSSKNDGDGIHIVSKEAIVAALSGIIKEETDKIKSEVKSNG